MRPFAHDQIRAAASGLDNSRVWHINQVVMPFRIRSRSSAAHVTFNESPLSFGKWSVNIQAKIEGLCHPFPSGFVQQHIVPFNDHNGRVWMDGKAPLDGLVEGPIVPWQKVNTVWLIAQPAQTRDSGMGIERRLRALHLAKPHSLPRLRVAPSGR